MFANAIKKQAPLAERVWDKVRPSVFGDLDSDLATVIETLMGRQDANYANHRRGDAVGLVQMNDAFFLLYRKADQSDVEWSMIGHREDFQEVINTLSECVSLDDDERRYFVSKALKLMEGAGSHFLANPEQQNPELEKYLCLTEREQDFDTPMFIH